MDERITYSLVATEVQDKMRIEKGGEETLTLLKMARDWY
jgi:hypothetical protein